MGKTYSHFIKRPVKNWNVEDRAFKQLDKIEKKATQAPRHPGSKKYIDNIAKEHPEVVSQVSGTNEQLIANMADMLAKPEKQSEIISKRAKRVRKTEDEDYYGYEEPEKIPDGKISIKRTLDFLAKNQEDPEKFNVDYLSKEYKLDNETAQRIMRYYQLFQLFTPKPQGAPQLKESKSPDKLLGNKES